MGRVYRARHLSLGRVVALKVLAFRAGGADDVLRFQREIRIHCKLAHPHVVELFEAEVDSDRVYLAMELVEGPSLAVHLSRHQGGLAGIEARRFAAQIASGLAYLHSNGIVHRDVKPDNVLIDLVRGARLADLGLARDAGSTALTATGKVFGTLHYMAPEVIKEEKPGAPADVYALGLILFEMLTGSLPYKGETPAHWMHLIVRQEPELLRRRLPAESAQMEELISDLLCKDPTRRPTALEMLDRLERLSAGDAVVLEAVHGSRPTEVAAHPPVGAATVVVPRQTRVSQDALPGRPKSRVADSSGPLSRWGVGASVASSAVLGALLAVAWWVDAPVSAVVDPLPGPDRPSPSATRSTVPSALTTDRLLRHLRHLDTQLELGPRMLGDPPSAARRVAQLLAFPTADPGPEARALVQEFLVDESRPLPVRLELWGRLSRIQQALWVCRQHDLPVPSWVRHLCASPYLWQVYGGLASHTISVKTVARPNMLTNEPNALPQVNMWKFTDVMTWTAEMSVAPRSRAILRTDVGLIPPGLAIATTIDGNALPLLTDPTDRSRPDAAYTVLQLLPGLIKAGPHQVTVRCSTLLRLRKHGTFTVKAMRIYADPWTPKAIREGGRAASPPSGIRQDHQNGRPERQ